MLCKATNQCKASSFSAWLLLSLFLALSLSLSLALPPSSSSRCTPLTQLLPQPASSAASGIHSKKHTLLGVAPRLRSHREEKEGDGATDRGELEIQKGYVCRDQNRGVKGMQNVQISQFFSCACALFCSFAVSTQRQISVICHVSHPKIRLNAAAERL